MDLWDDIILSVFLCEAGGMFVRQPDSGSEMDDDTQLKFYTEHRGRRRSKGNHIHLHQSFYTSNRNKGVQLLRNAWVPKHWNIT